MNEKCSRFRFFLDYEKEEKWVNEMAKEGWHLTDFNIGYYKFEKGAPGQYIYRNEMVNSLGAKGQVKDYLEFLQQSGVELVKTRGMWAYFRKATADGPFELYSDTSSKLAYMKRIFLWFFFFFLLNFYFTISNIGEESVFRVILGSLNLLAAILLFIPIVKVGKKIGQLKKNLDLFND